MFTTKIIPTSIAVLALLMLVSCGKKEEPKTATPPPATTAAPAPKAPPAPPPVAAPAPQAVAPASPAIAPAPTPEAAAPAPQAAAPAPAPQAAAPAAGGPVLARSDGEKTGLSVEVTELKRGSGGTVTLKFTMVNNTKEQISFSWDYGDRALGMTDQDTVGGVHLIDAVNKKKYLVVRDSERKCVCSVVKGGLKVGDRTNLWAKFPAPPADVKVISVLIPHFAPMDDVPVSP